MNNQQKPNIKFNYQNEKPKTKLPVPIPQQMQMQMPQQMQMQMPQQMELNNCVDFAQMSNCEANCQLDYPNSNFITLLNKKEDDKDKKVVAMIVSFVGGCTYDSLFTTIEQKSPEGTKVLVYSCSASFVKNILDGFKDPASIENDDLKQLLINMKELDPDCIVFNWECCSNYESQSFSEGRRNVFQFVKLIIDRGHMAMFSDFSLMALINQWDPQYLGPNPFVKVSVTSESIDLFFKKQDLIQCPSAQLQIVGEMAQGGRVHVEVMGGTIVYSVKKERQPTNRYDLKVLTIASSQYLNDVHGKLNIEEKSGHAGHVLLTYKSGGSLLTSMGHWAELMRVDTTDHKLFEMAERQYGSEVASKMKMEYASMDMEQQRCYVQSQAVNMIQNQAPAMNMMMKNAPTKGKKKF